MELPPLDDLPPRVVHSVHVEHREAVIPGGGAAGGWQRQGSPLLELLKINGPDEKLFCKSLLKIAINLVIFKWSGVRVSGCRFNLIKFKFLHIIYNSFIGCQLKKIQK